MFCLEAGLGFSFMLKNNPASCVLAVSQPGWLTCDFITRLLAEEGQKLEKMPTPVGSGPSQVIPQDIWNVCSGSRAQRWGAWTPEPRLLGVIPPLPATNWGTLSELFILSEPLFIYPLKEDNGRTFLGELSGGLKEWVDTERWELWVAASQWYSISKMQHLSDGVSDWCPTQCPMTCHS